MNKEECEIEQKRLRESFESFVKSELPTVILDRSDDWMSGYSNKTTSTLFHLYRAGWYNKHCDTITHGCPDLARLYGMNHPRLK